jgi:hypothetical protein
MDITETSRDVNVSIDMVEDVMDGNRVISMKRKRHEWSDNACDLVSKELREGYHDFFVAVRRRGWKDGVHGVFAFCDTMESGVIACRTLRMTDCR